MKAAFRIASFLSVISTTAMAVSINLEEPKTITAEKIEYNVKADEIKTVGDTEITNKSRRHVLFYQIPDTDVRPDIIEYHCLQYFCFFAICMNQPVSRVGPICWLFLCRQQFLFHRP